MVEVGALYPLTKDGEVDPSFPSLPIREGLNIFGRSDSALFTKQISRKHISITASPNGNLEISVEGPNPIILISGATRKKLALNSKCSLAKGDVIEFTPRELPFKYISKTFHGPYGGSMSGVPLVPLENDQQGAEEVSNAYLKEDEMVRKRKSQVEEDEVLARMLQEEEDGAGRDEFGASGLSNSGLERSDAPDLINSTRGVPDIKRFKLDPKRQSGGSTFRLMHTQSIPHWANTGCIRVQDVIQGDIQMAILSNYMVDVNWLLSACPVLNRVPQVVMIHGEHGQSLELLQASKPRNWVLFKPPLPISYGTHHSKAMFLVYPRGVRVIVHTANLIHADWNNKTQGLWMQDFPSKFNMGQMARSDFENDLVEYLEALKWPGCTMILPHLGETKITAGFFRSFNYSAASVRLVASVPGYHRGRNVTKWGHMKLRTVLGEQIFEDQFQSSPLVFQFSSLGSLDENWINELTASMSAGSTVAKKPLGFGKVQIVWPTVDDIRSSLEGYTAGSSVPSPEKNVKKDFLKKYWAHWKAEYKGRSRATPHIKSYVRYNGQSLAWFLLTSSNLSKAAWGSLQKDGTQIMIRSYELGVCFLPSLVLGSLAQQTFSCTDTVLSLASVSQSNSLAPRPKNDPQTRHLHAKLVTSCHVNEDEENSTEIIVQLPVPYSLPPPPYGPGDVPWAWDVQYKEPDVYGGVWPPLHGL